MLDADHEAESPCCTLPPAYPRCLDDIGVTRAKSAADSLSKHPRAPRVFYWLKGGTSGLLEVLFVLRSRRRALTETSRLATRMISDTKLPDYVMIWVNKRVSHA